MKKISLSQARRLPRRASLKLRHKYHSLGLKQQTQLKMAARAGEMIMFGAGIWGIWHAPWLAAGLLTGVWAGAILARALAIWQSWRALRHPLFFLLAAGHDLGAKPEDISHV